jgi:uncharacterized protein YqeY
VSAFLARLQSDLAAARKAQDKVGVLVLGSLLAEMKNREIELRRELTDADAAEVVQKAMKRRRESIELFLSAGREDLVVKERAEAEVLERYLPEQVDDAEIRSAVQAAIAAGAANIGAVMGKVMPQFKGRAEGSVINAIAREELGKQC